MRVKLFYHKDQKDPVYYIQHGFRDASGKPTTEVVKKFRHSELLKITDDPLAYVQAEIDRMNAEDAEQKRLAKEQKKRDAAAYAVDLDFTAEMRSDGETRMVSTVRNIGYFFLQSIMGVFHMKDFFQKETADRKDDPAYDVWRFLVYDRILYPASVPVPVRDLPVYLEQPDMDHQQVLQFLDFLQEHGDGYLTWLFRNSRSMVQRDTSVLFYHDCSDLFCEMEGYCQGHVDGVTGEVVYGRRGPGSSRGYRPGLFGEMGLLLDGRGIPVAMCFQPGSMNEQTAVVSLGQDIRKMLDDARIVYCGEGPYDNASFGSMTVRGSIVTRPVEQLSEALQEAALDDRGYRRASSDEPVSIAAMKSFPGDRKEDRALYDDQAYKVIPIGSIEDAGLHGRDADGSIRKTEEAGALTQRAIILFSRKMMEHDKEVRDGKIQRAKLLLAARDPETIRKGPEDVMGYIRAGQTQPGEDLPAQYVLDMEKIAEEERYDGWYVVITDLEGPVRDILAASRQRDEIEGCFQVIRDILSGRLVEGRPADHILAYLLLCYTALLVIRLLETELDEMGAHLTSQELIRILRTMDVAEVGRKYFHSLYAPCKGLKALTELTGLPLNRYYYKPTDLRAYIRKDLR